MLAQRRLFDFMDILSKNIKQKLERFFTGVDFEEESQPAHVPAAARGVRNAGKGCPLIVSRKVACLRLPVRVRTQTGATHRQAKALR